VVLFGARTGGDGVGGASILAADSVSADGPTKRPAVQLGDPFAEQAPTSAKLHSQMFLAVEIKVEDFRM